MKVNSNMQALIANNVLKMNEQRNAKSTEKLSSGYKLNRASDSPSGMAISNKMRIQINSLNKAKDNTSNAVNAIHTADGALQEVHDMLQRMNQLSIKASTGTLADSDREAIQLEVNALSDEINRVANDTEYNTQNLLGGEQSMKGYVTSLTGGTDAKLKVVDFDSDFPIGQYTLTKDADDTFTLTSATGTVSKSGIEDNDGRLTITLEDGSRLILDSFSKDALPDSATFELTDIGGMKIQVGAQGGQEVRVTIPNMDTRSIGIDDISMLSMDSATSSIDKISDAIEYVSRARAKLGAYENRFESTISSLAENIEDLTTSYSTIKDVDMAEEMVNYTTMQVLVQAGTSMLTQANEQPQQALQLLQ